MQQHVREQHTNERPYVCADCGRDFTRQGSLNRHMAKVHHEVNGYGQGRRRRRAAAEPTADKPLLNDERAGQVTVVPTFDRDMTADATFGGKNDANSPADHEEWRPRREPQREVERQDSAVPQPYIPGYRNVPAFDERLAANDVFGMTFGTYAEQVAANRHPGIQRGGQVNRHDYLPTEPYHPTFGPRMTADHAFGDPNGPATEHDSMDYGPLPKRRRLTGPTNNFPRPDSSHPARVDSPHVPQATPPFALDPAMTAASLFAPLDDSVFPDLPPLPVHRSIGSVEVCFYCSRAYKTRALSAQHFHELHLNPAFDGCACDGCGLMYGTVIEDPMLTPDLAPFDAGATNLARDWSRVNEEGAVEGAPNPDSGFVVDVQDAFQLQETGDVVDGPNVSRLARLGRAGNGDFDHDYDELFGLTTNGEVAMDDLDAVYGNF